MANIRKELVLAYIRKYHPTNIEELRERLEKEGIGSTDEALFEAVGQLKAEGVALTLLPKEYSAAKYLADAGNSWWLYMTFVITAMEAVLVLDQVQTGILSSVRLLFGVALLGYLPGLATTWIVFPGEQLKGFERALMSIFLSVAISIALGVALGAVYRFSGTTSVLLSTLYIVVATLLGGYREYSWLKRRTLNPAT